MSVHIAMVATILATTQWCMDSADALQYNGYELDSLLAKAVYTGGEDWYVNVERSVH